MDEEIEKPWDVKVLNLYLGSAPVGESDLITFTVFDNTYFNIYEGEGGKPGKWFYEDIDIDAARKLRDFLNYAIPK